MAKQALTTQDLRTFSNQVLTFSREPLGDIFARLRKYAADQNNAEMKRKIQELRELEEKTCIKIDNIVPASLLSQLNDTETARRQCYLNGWAL